MQTEMVPIGERTRGKDRRSKTADRVGELASASASGFAENFDNTVYGPINAVQVTSSAATWLKRTTCPDPSTPLEPSAWIHTKPNETKTRIKMLYGWKFSRRVNINGKVRAVVGGVFPEPKS
jgi:hypothetical protein